MWWRLYEGVVTSSVVSWVVVCVKAVMVGGVALALMVLLKSKAELKAEDFRLPRQTNKLILIDS